MQRYGTSPASAQLGIRTTAWARRRPSRTARLATPRVVVLTLSVFLVIAFAHVHEMVSFLIPIPLGKLIGLPLVIVAFQRLPWSQVRAAMRTAPGRGAMWIGIMMVLSVPLSIWVGHSVGYLTSTGAITTITFVVTAAVLVDRRAIPIVLATEVFAVGLGAMRMLVPGAPSMVEDGVVRLYYGYTYDPNDCAALFLLTIPLALYLAGRLPRARLLWYMLAVVMVAAIVRTGSRGGLIGFGALVTTLAMLAPPRQRARLTGAAIVAATAFAAFVSQNEALRTRFASTFDTSQSDYNYTQTNGRVEIWKRGIHYMVTHPVTGVGIANFTTAEYQIGSGLKAAQGITDQHMLTAHNSVIQIGAELGFPGLFAYLFMVGSAIWGAWRRRRDSIAMLARRAPSSAGGPLENEIALASSVLTALVAIVVAGCFLSLAYSPITLFACALAAGLVAGNAPHASPGPVPRRSLAAAGAAWRGRFGTASVAGITRRA